jgi:hypothetical protein
MTADAINDVANAINEFPELKRQVEDAQRQLQSAKDQLGDLNKAMDRYRDPATGEWKQDLLASDMMEGAARTNDCISARRCQLVPFNHLIRHEAQPSSAFELPDPYAGICSHAGVGCHAYQPNSVPAGRVDARVLLALRL